MKTYTTKQVSQILGMTVPGVLTAAKSLGIEPAKKEALTATGFTYEFSEDQLDLLRSRPKRGRPKEKK